MFKKIRLKNFRTHRDTEIVLQDITLLIGSNNAGKSNLFVGMQHFSRLVARARPKTGRSTPEDINDDEPNNKLRKIDFFPQRHRLSQNEPITFICEWSHKLGSIAYEIILYEDKKLSEEVGCKEKIVITYANNAQPIEITSGWDKPTDELSLRTLLIQKLAADQQRLTNAFFSDLVSCYSYNFQPAFLKGKVKIDSIKVDPNNLRIATQLGHEGSNLQEILALIKQKEPATLDRFLVSLRRFDPSFHGIEPKGAEVLWYFDLGKNPPTPDSFWSSLVSDGLLRAAAIALLTSMQRPPSLILIEEIENGINQKNLSRFIDWLKQAAGVEGCNERGLNTQFILTTHSPSIIREFSDELDKIYHIRIDRRGYKSVVINLNSALSSFVEIGTVEGTFEDKNGQRIVKIAPDKLVELWFSGTIGGEISPS